jgi:hypothetical protein
MMFALYIGNILQGILLYYMTIDYCYSVDPNDSIKACFKYYMFYDSLFALTVLSWVTLILSIWNSIRCQRNFDLNVGFYSKLFYDTLYTLSKCFFIQFFFPDTNELL